MAAVVREAAARVNGREKEAPAKGRGSRLEQKSREEKTKAMKLLSFCVPLSSRAEQVYCTTSPCRLMSRPSTSTAWLTRTPVTMLQMMRITKVATAVQMMVAAIPSIWIDHLVRIAVEQALGRVAADCRPREHAGQQCADDAAHGVNAERIERVVVAERLLHGRGREEAADAGRCPDPQRPDWVDEARSRGDGHESGHGARDDAEHARLLVHEPFGEHPRQAPPSPWRFASRSSPCQRGRRRPTLNRR